MIVVPFEEFETTWTKLQQSKKKVQLLFTSSKNQDGSYWCPDCEDIKPLYKDFQSEAAAKGLELYCFIAGDRPTWKDPENKFRKHPDIHLSSVPTMGLFDGKKLINSLDGKEMQKQGNRKMLYD